MNEEKEKKLKGSANMLSKQNRLDSGKCEPAPLNMSTMLSNKNPSTCLLMRGLVIGQSGWSARQKQDILGFKNHYCRSISSLT